MIITQFIHDAWFVVLNAILFIGMSTLLIGAIGLFLTIWHWAYGTYKIVLMPTINILLFEFEQRSKAYFTWLVNTKNEAFKRREPEGATQ